MHFALLLLTGALSLVSAPVFAAKFPPANPFIAGDRVVFLGDSITPFGNQARGYVEVPRTVLSAPGHPAVTVINAGISGNKVPDLVGLLEADVLRKSPSVVFIHIGINDVWHNQGNLSAPRTAFITGLREILDTLKAQGVVTVLATPSVIGEKPAGGNELDAALDAFAESSRALATEFGIELCDLRRAFTDRVHQIAKAETTQPALTNDGVHLSDAGNALVADLAMRSLRHALEQAVPQAILHGGDFVGTSTVRIGLRPSPQTVGLNIRYTLDGSEPGANAALYGQPLTLTATTTVTARTFRRATAIGGVSQLVCTERAAQAAVVTTGTVPGLAWSLYDRTFDNLPVFATLTPVRTGVTAAPDLAVAQREAAYALRFTGFLTVPQAGMYRFSLTSDDGIRLTLGTTVVIDNDGQHGNRTITGTIALAACSHACDLQFFQGGGGASLTLAWALPGGDLQSVPGAAFTANP